MNLEDNMKDDIKLLGLHPKWAIFRDICGSKGLMILGKRSTIAKRGRNGRESGCSKINGDDDDGLQNTNKQQGVESTNIIYTLLLNVKAHYT